MKSNMSKAITVSLMALVTLGCSKKEKESPRPAPKTAQMAPQMAQMAPKKVKGPAPPAMNPVPMPPSVQPTVTPQKTAPLPKGTLLAKVTRRKRRTMIRSFTNSYSFDGAISVKMAPDKSVTITDKGRWQDLVANMRKSICQTESEERTWQATYKGTWSQKGELLLFKVKRTAESCKQVKKCDNRPPVNKKCPKTATSVTFTCTKESVTVRGSAKPLPAWNCAPGEAKTHTHGPWKFGLTQCIERYSGNRGPNSYNLCKP